MSEVNTIDWWTEYYKKYRGDMVDFERFREMAKNIQQNDKVLDVGGGRGEFLVYVGDKCERHLLDFTPEALDIANGRAEKIVAGNCYAIPYENDCFDVVTCGEVVEHLDHPKECVKELVRVSKKWVVVSVPNGKSIPDPSHINEYTPESLVGLLTPYGIVETKLVSGNQIIVAHLCKE